MGILNRRSTVLPTPESITQLKHQSLQLEQVSAKLKERDRVLFEMVTKAVTKKDMARAQIYANELSRVRQIKQGISQSQLAIDCIMIRLESFLDLYQVVKEMKPISKVVREVSNDVQTVMPQFATVIEQLNEVASEALLETEVDFRQPTLEDALSVKSQDGAEILNDVSTLIEHSLHESFPEPPILQLNSAEEAIECTEEPTFTPRLTNFLEESNEWDTLSDDVVKILDKLSSKGRVKMEELEA